MRNSRRAALAIVAIATLLTALLGATAASAAQKQTKPKSGGSVTWLISSEASSMDPNIAGTIATPAVYSVYDRLIYIDPESGKILPGLAASLTASSDAKVWTIKLQPKLKFTDGTTLDAQAVLYNWNRLKNTPTATDRSNFDSITSYEATDPTTIKVTLASPNGGFPLMLVRSMGTIASPAALEKYGASYGTSASTIVGAGPFKVSEWVRADHMTLVKNPDYWDAPKPYLDNLILRPVADLTQKTNAVIAGQAQMAWMPIASQNDQTLTSAGYKFAGVVQDGGIAVLYNASKPPLNDATVRQALTLAITPDDLNAKATGSNAIMIDTYAAKESPYYDPSVKQTTNNLTKAQKLIDAYVSSHGNQPVSFTMLYTTSLQNWADPTMQQWARLKNVNVTPDLQSPTVGMTKGQSGQFDAWYASTTASRSARYLDTYYALYHTGVSTNITKYSNPQLDKVLDAGRGAVGVAETKGPIQKVEGILVADSAFTMIYRLQQKTYYAKNVQGVKMIDDSYPATKDIWLSSGS